MHIIHSAAAAPQTDSLLDHDVEVNLSMLEHVECGNVGKAENSAKHDNENKTKQV